MDVKSYGLSKKYTDERVKELTGLDMSSVNQAIEGKADKTKVNSLESQLAQKASQSDLETTNTNVTNLQSVKADKTELDTKISQMQSGVKGTYATLTDLQTAFPSGDTGNYVLQSDGSIYNWDGSAWVDTGIQYQSSGIARGSVSARKTDFLNITVTSKNIYNENDEEIVSSMILTDTGGLTSNGSYDTSGYMMLEDREGAVWASWESGSLSIIRGYAFYDDNRNFISGSGSSTANGFSIPIGAKYLRISYPKTAVKYQIEVGSGQTTYEPYSEISLINENKIRVRNQLTEGSVNPSTTNFMELRRSSKNLFNPSDPDHKTGVYLTSTGTLAGNGNYNTSGYMDVSERLAEYTYASRSSTTTYNPLVRAYAFYDSSKTFISGWSDTTDTNNIPIPTNAVYMRISYDKTSVDYQVEFGSYFTGYEPYEEKYFFDEQTIEIKTENSNNSNPWENKKVAFNGDSITAGSTGTTGDYTGTVAYPILVAENLGFTLDNYAIGGSTIAVNETKPTEKTPIVSRYQSMDDGAEVVVIAGGTNDWANQWTPIGTMADRTDYTFYGALHNLCLGLLDKYIGKQLLFMTPIKRYGQGTTNDLGYTLEQYADIIIEVCSYYGIPVLDMYREAPINTAISTQTTALAPDGTHPNKLGQEVMARRVTGYLRQLI